ncbi:MAG TPA: LysM domain-containing protein [Acidovorax sp.]|nr:LysM domain-containing protein [Acidovorax sp.]
MAEQSDVQQTINNIAAVFEHAQQPLRSDAESKQYLRVCFGADNHHVQQVFDHHKDAIEAQRGQIRSRPAAELQEQDVASFVFDQGVPAEWVAQRQQDANTYMKHLIVLSFLMEDQHSVERQQFLNARLQRLDRNINSPAELASFWGNTLAATESASLLRATAPKAYMEANRFIAEQAIDADMKAAGWPANRVTPSAKDDLKLQKAFAARVDPVAGPDRWREALRSVKDAYLRGAGDKRVSLALSGTLLGLSVMAGTGPAGLVIGGLKLGKGLLSTSAGQAFQEKLFAGAKGFFASVGVKPEAIAAVGNTVSTSVQTALSSKWGQRALMGVAIGAVVFGSFDAPSVPQGTLVGGEHIVLSNETPMVFREVAAGDSLSKIAKSHIESITGVAPTPDQVSQWVKTIQMENQIANPDRIFPGQQLILPARAPDILPSHFDPSTIQPDQIAAAPKVVPSRSPSL